MKTTVERLTDLSAAIWRKPGYKIILRTSAPLFANFARKTGRLRGYNGSQVRKISKRIVLEEIAALKSVWATLVHNLSWQMYDVPPFVFILSRWAFFVKQ